MRVLMTVGLMLLMSLTTLCQADDVRPLIIDIQELPAGQFQQADAHHYRLRWRIPPTVRPDNFPQITLPETCQVLGVQSEVLSKVIRQAVGQKRYRCSGTLAGRLITVTYPKITPAISSVIKFAAQTGERHRQLLRPAQDQWRIPRAESVSSVALDYTRLGIEHIWAGLDHLLFVLCLLWIAGTGRRMLITITGFTLAHSLTLILSALNWVRVPVPPVEAIIALSIVFLAGEIARGKRDSLTWRHPISVSSSFGLLHGFGFAAALSEIGLPQTEQLSGLLFFNLGVEIGQVLFAAAVIGLMHLLKVMQGQTSLTAMQQGSRLVCSYGVGAVASCWLIDRCLGF